ncbi:hypothetical protein BX600DRAFT_436095 [Xylariales sp. PMI_506]|nr:hypothetical protein BX600DRAFT_436095 [Xylariales sp. PMI_506]
MQTVPSLVGTGTAVAAASTGLIFGQLPEGQLPPPSPRPDSSYPSEIAGPEQELNRNAVASRPDTTDSAAGVADIFTQSIFSLPSPTQPRIPRRSSQTQITSPRTANWRHSYVKQVDSTAPIPENPRDSFSSNGSWIRRLSLRPLSQHESLKSSSGPDNQSMFSHGSAAPILLPAIPQLPPNKLVKRSSASNGTSPGPVIQRSSRSQLPTLRRPATSHQRSATLHQLAVEAVPPVPEYSFNQPSRPRAQTVGVPQRSPVVEVPSTYNLNWKSFFHARIARIVNKSSPKKGDSSAQPSAKRICVDQGSYIRPYLIAPRSVMANPTTEEIYPTIEPEVEPSAEVEESSPHSSHKTGSPAGATPSKTPRRSISMQFGSPSSWISKTGSIRRRKRGGGDEPDAGDSQRRNVSDPVPTPGVLTKPFSADDGTATHGMALQDNPNNAEAGLAAIFQPPHSRSRDSSSPLPPLSRLSSFHMDLNRLGSSSSVQAKPDEPLAATNNATNIRITSQSSQTRTLDRVSTVGSSDYHRGFTSGDDDDTDFKTDTPFDSLRTVASGRRGALDSPLESMFDESPPSTAGNNKQPKRLSIQEILGPSYDGGNKIMEEDETLTTPVRGVYDDAEVNFRLAKFGENEGFSYPRDSSGFSLASKDFGRASLDDDDDLGWARDDEDVIYNHLSPPSSMNSRRGSPNQRSALASISGNGNHDLHTDSSSQRPRSNLFDWSEVPHHDKLEGESHYLRPKTVHGKQEIDLRGGRSNSRKRPAVAHVRSQSVPVVPDPADSSKSTPKFGTWGLSSKNVSEDWDSDFVFEEEGDVSRSEGKKVENRLSMVVPASIQATQPTVKAHSEQIRELSLLVNDLKRLSRLGREMDMLNGTYAELWREADGIIALASPDEDSLVNTVSSSDTDDFNTSLIDERFLDEGFEGRALEMAEPVSKVDGLIKTAVIKERPTVRRRSVFLPDDDIFGSWAQAEDECASQRPKTPEPKLPGTLHNPSSVIAKSLMESMHLRRRQDLDTEHKQAGAAGKLNFDTNSLKELVKRAGDLRHALADLVCRAEQIIQSPNRTPRRERPIKNEDGSPAFTRVFDDPASSPSRPLVQSRSSNSVLNGSAISASPSNALNQRIQMMTVS